VLDLDAEELEAAAEVEAPTLTLGAEEEEPEEPEDTEVFVLTWAELLELEEVWLAVVAALESPEVEVLDVSLVVLLTEPLSPVALTVSALGLSPPLKSVTYQPEPLS
jgi:hypothetical protein